MAGASYEHYWRSKPFNPSKLLLKERERTIENYIVQKAKRLGYISRKMNGLGFRDWPDRLFINIHSGAVVWLEVKRPGEEPTPNQSKLHKMLIKAGQDVQVFDNRQKALDYLKKVRDFKPLNAGSRKHINAKR